MNNEYGNIQSGLQLASLVNKHNKSLSIKERLALKKKVAEEKELKRVDQAIQAGLCPYCGVRLIRGKKDKHNDYKRVWTCSAGLQEYYR